MVHEVILYYSFSTVYEVTEEQIKNYSGHETDIEKICEQIAIEEYQFDAKDMSQIDFDSAMYSGNDEL